MKFSRSQRGKRQLTESHYAHVRAEVPDTQWDLYTTLLTGFYTAALSTPPVLSAVRREIGGSDPELIAALAVHFGEQRQQTFRELAFLLSAELAAQKRGDEPTALLVARIVRHPADIPRWLEHFGRATRYGQRPGRAIRRQLTILLNRLDEYQYGRSSREMQIALRNALHLLRPRAADRTRGHLFSRISRDLIPVRTTWEQEWHALYRQHCDSPEQRQVILREKWKEGISSFRIGYTALLDNLRPMLCAGVSGKVLLLAAEYLGNAAAVRRSGISSLRLLEAYRGLRRMDNDGAGRLSEALEKAVLHSSWAQCTFGMSGISVIAMDVSNSMKRPVDTAGGAQRFDIAPLLAMLWKSRGDTVITGVLGNTWRTLDLPDRPVLMAVDAFRAHEGEAGYAINAWLMLQDLLRKRQPVDRVLVFTDARLWNDRRFHQPPGADLGHWWGRYRREIAPHAKLYLFDLSGPRSLECLEEDIFLIGGWKEHIGEVLDALETGFGKN